MGYSKKYHITGTMRNGQSGVLFNHIFVPDDLLNSFLYRLMLSNRRKELIKRIDQGRKQEISCNDPYYHGWLLENEDQFVKQLISEKD